MAALSEIVISNLALNRIGTAYQLPAGDGTLAGSTDTSVEKAILLLNYERVRNKLLEGFPWTFARRYATLTLFSDGTGKPWIDEWANAYTYPSDCLRIRRFVTDVGHWYWNGIWSEVSPPYYFAEWTGDPHWEYVVRLDGTTKVILTDVATADADLEYTQLVTAPTLFTEQFASALAWGLAAEIATPLSVDRPRRQEAVQMYIAEMRIAMAGVSNEEHVKDQHDGTFAASRGIW